MLVFPASRQSLLRAVIPIRCECRSVQTQGARYAGSGESITIGYSHPKSVTCRLDREPDLLYHITKLSMDPESTKASNLCPFMSTFKHIVSLVEISDTAYNEITSSVPSSIVAQLSAISVGVSLWKVLVGFPCTVVFVVVLPVVALEAVIVVKRFIGVPRPVPRCLLFFF